MQCGIASLSMICQYYGRPYSINYLSELCQATTEGVSMLGITDTATQLGLIALTAFVSPEDLLRKDVSLPAILHWKQNHFVVLYKIKHNYFYIADPAKGLLKFSYTEFINNWISTNHKDREKGVAMFIETTPAFYTNSEIIDDNSKPYEFLIHYVNLYKYLV